MYKTKYHVFECVSYNASIRDPSLVKAKLETLDDNAIVLWDLPVGKRIRDTKFHISYKQIKELRLASQHRGLQ